VTDKKPVAYFIAGLVILVFGVFMSHNWTEKRLANPGSAIAEGDVLFIMHGSNTIGGELAPALAEAYLKKLGGKDVKVVASDKNNIEKQVQAVLPGQAKPQKIMIAAHGSTTAFEGLQKGICDIGMASRKIKDKEVEQLASKNLGDLTLLGSENIIGLDGIAIIINASQPITKLQKEDIAKIFTGQISDWSAVGGNPGPIHIYSRDNKSGTYDTFSSLVLNNQQLAGTAKKYEDSEAMARDISQDPAGIGFIGLPYVGSTRAVAVAEANATALLPSQFTVATEDYPLSRRLYLYIAQNSKNKHAKEFIRFCMSAEGQDIVKKIGFVAQNIEISKVVESDSPWINQEKKKQYRNIIANSQGRFSLNFRFNPNSTILDNKALHDVERVVQFLSAGNNQNYKIVLLGFADSVGDYGANVALSEQRALVVRDQIIFRNKELANKIDVVGFGPEESVASNATDDGRAKNRRVEIWLRN
jgi:phosphate transport system substrate-binding protein